MSEKETLCFAELYESARNHHPSIMNMDSAAIGKVEENIERAKRSFRTKEYIVIFLSGLFFFGTGPFLLKIAYHIAIEWQTQLSVFLRQGHFFYGYSVESASALLVIIMVMPYLILYPTKWFREHVLLRKFKRIDIFSEIREEFDIFDIDRSKPIFIVFTFTTVYILILIPFSYTYSHVQLPCPILDALVTWWLLIPMLFLVALLNFLLLVLLTVLFLLKGDMPYKPKPIAIIYNLFELIHMLDEDGDLSNLCGDSRARIIRSIIRISDFIRGMYEGTTSGYGISQWSAKEINRAADNFLSLAAWLYFPQVDTFKNLAERLCEYINTFVSGYYHTLPRQELNDFGVPSLARLKRAGLRRAWRFILFAAYMGLPIAAAVIIVTLFDFSFSPLVQPILSVLYVIWSILGMIAFADALSPVAKDLVGGIVRSVIGGK
jgi:hypothetical protein